MVLGHHPSRDLVPLFYSATPLFYYAFILYASLLPLISLPLPLSLLPLLIFYLPLISTYLLFSFYFLQGTLRMHTIPEGTESHPHTQQQPAAPTRERETSILR